MATFFPNPNDQRYASSAAAQMHYLREALPSSYSETPIVPGNNMMMYMSYPSSSNDVPPVTGSDSAPSQQEVLSNLGVSQMGEHDFNAWGNTRGEMSFMHPMGSGSATSLLQGVQNLQGQGLSLSLGTQIPGSGFSSFLNPRDDDNSHTIPNSMKMDVSSYGMSSVGRNIPNSKYLKAAQQLLDEVVNVRQALKQSESKKDLTRGSRDDNGGSMNESSVHPNAEESANNNQSELSAAERQDLQNKLTKLLSMLDEVDRRYKQYFHQMQIVVSSFDVIAGPGAAKPYTALALQTISRHFRCLRDAIAGQIRLTQKSLGDQDGSANGKGVAISRLRYVDQHLKQQRALQQLGMMQQHAWRPQRGLPESSVSILRAWLFEHFLHPYPKDSEKIMLARQTGLTRSQVSNWFINARVRLWKPMVEEMYKEETGDVDMDSNSSSELAAPKPPPKGDTIPPSDDRGEDHQQTATSTATEQYGVHRVPNVGMVGTTNAETGYGFVRSKGQERPPSMDESSLFPDAFMSRAAAYDISELGRFGNGNGVSLTLGLQHCEEGGLPMSVENHHSFITMRESDMYHAAASSSVDPQTGDFDCLDGSENRQHRFSSSSHLLHDFVA